MDVEDTVTTSVPSDQHPKSMKDWIIL